MIDVNAEFCGRVLLILYSQFGEKLFTRDEGNRLVELCGEIERFYKSLSDLKEDEETPAG